MPISVLLHRRAPLRWGREDWGRGEVGHVRRESLDWMQKVRSRYWRLRQKGRILDMQWVQERKGSFKRLVIY
jgi:hypothetical protein